MWLFPLLMERIRLPSQAIGLGPNWTEVWWLVQWIRKSTCLIESLFCSLMLSFQERTLEEHMKLVEKIMKHDKNRRKRIEAAGVDYECPEIVWAFLPLPIYGCLFVFVKRYRSPHLEFCSHVTYVMAVAGG